MRVFEGGGKGIGGKRNIPNTREEMEGQGLKEQE